MKAVSLRMSRTCAGFFPYEFFGFQSGMGFYTAMSKEKPAWQAMFFPFQMNTWIVSFITFIAFLLFVGKIYPEENAYIKVLSWQMLTLTGRGTQSHFK